MAKPIFLDNNATTPIDPRVCDVMDRVARSYFGNPASSTHTYGWQADTLVTIAREHCASLINSSEEEIIFTSGATESNNIALFGSILPFLEQGKRPRVLSVQTEHKSIIDPLSELSRLGVDVELLRVEKDGSISIEQFTQALKTPTTLVSAMLANNEIGTIHDIQALSKIAKQTNTLFHCDATQALGKIPVDVKTLDVDFISFSAHKLYGPKGVGALFGKKQSLKNLKPFIFGGGHEQGLRAGTLNTIGIAGFGEACRLSKEEFEANAKHLRSLSKKMLSNLLNKISEVTLHGPLEKRLPGSLNLFLKNVDSATLIGELQTKVAISKSSACSSKEKAGSHVLRALNVAEEALYSSIRIGIGKFTTEEEIERACELISEAVNKIRR